MPSLSFEVFCGICKRDIYHETEVEGNVVTVICSHCNKTIYESKYLISDLHKKVKELENGEEHKRMTREYANTTNRFRNEIKDLESKIIDLEVDIDRLRGDVV